MKLEAADEGRRGGRGTPTFSLDPVEVRLVLGPDSLGAALLPGLFGVVGSQVPAIRSARDGGPAIVVDRAVLLVVPAKLIDSFPKPVRPHLQTLESFIGDVRLIGAQGRA